MKIAEPVTAEKISYAFNVPPWVFSDVERPALLGRLRWRIRGHFWRAGFR